MIIHVLAGTLARQGYSRRSGRDARAPRLLYDQCKFAMLLAWEGETPFEPNYIAIV